jgi:hypothetical protein
MKNMGEEWKNVEYEFFFIERVGRLHCFFIHLQERLHDFHPWTRGYTFTLEPLHGSSRVITYHGFGISFLLGWKYHNSSLHGWKYDILILIMVGCIVFLRWVGFLVFFCFFFFFFSPICIQPWFCTTYLFTWPSIWVVVLLFANVNFALHIEGFFQDLLFNQPSICNILFDKILQKV